MGPPADLFDVRARRMLRRLAEPARHRSPSLDPPPGHHLGRGRGDMGLLLPGRPGSVARVARQIGSPRTSLTRRFERLGRTDSNGNANQGGAMGVRRNRVAGHGFSSSSRRSPAQASRHRASPRWRQRQRLHAHARPLWRASRRPAAAHCARRRHLPLPGAPLVAGSVLAPGNDHLTLLDGRATLASGCESRAARSTTSAMNPFFARPSGRAVLRRRARRRLRGHRHR